MNIRFSALATIVAAALVLASTDFASAQAGPPAGAVAEQDTAQARAGTRARARRPGMMGRQRAMMLRGGQAGPRALIGLKDELALSEDQVARLEKIRDDHRSQMQSQAEKARELTQALQEARRNRDWNAIEKGIDELGKQRTAMAKSQLNVQRQSLNVLTAQQRSKFETWQEGARLFQRERFRGMRELMRGQRMRGRRTPPGDGGGPPNL